MAAKILLAQRCTCAECRAGGKPAQRQAHEHIHLLLTRLDEQQRRWFVAVLAEQYGLRKGGVRVLAQVTGMSEKTIRRGLKELKGGLVDAPEGRIRRRGAGRPRKKRQTYPANSTQSDIPFVC